MANARENSRKDWTFTAESDPEALKLGALQRIADACELMAKEHARLVREREMFERSYKEQRKHKEQAQRTAAGLRGQITKLKRQLAEAKGALDAG